MATYYLRADGTAANKAAAGGPDTDVTACMDISTHNNQDFSAGDIVLVSSEGGIYRAQLNTPTSGTSGSRITYKPVPGSSPKIYGSELATTFVDQGSNKWRSDIGSTAPDQIWLSKNNNINHGIKVADTNSLAKEFDWVYIDAQYLWVYSTSDPDTVYDWVEAGQRNRCFSIDGDDYITVEGNLEFAFANDFGYYANDAETPIVDGITTHHNGVQDGAEDDGIIVQNSRDGVVKNCTSYDNGTHGIFVLCEAGNTVSGIVVENNNVYNNHHTQIDVQRTGGTFSSCIVRYNHCYTISGYNTDFTTAGIFAEAVADGVAGLQVYYNVCHDCSGAIGIHFVGFIASPTVYNNVIYGGLVNATDVGIEIDSDDATSALFKNNIAFDTVSWPFRITNAATVSDADNNIWFNSVLSSRYTDIGGVTYGSGDFAQFKTDTGWEANGFWENPDVLDASNNDFHLKTESPCIEAGVAVSAGSIDLDGIPLGRGINPDIGAFETLKGGARAL